MQTPADRTGRNALIWSLLGFFLCACFPLSLVGMALAFRARRLAREQGVAAPVTSTLAIALSAIALAAVTIFGIWFAHDEAQLHARIDELNARVSATDTGDLTDQLACDLAELRVRYDGWKDDDPIVVDGFECPGKVILREDGGELADFSFNASSVGRVTVTVCYKKGARWTVKSLREGAGCE